ncbi:MAG: hypothetical protein LBD20_05065 [Spirochaetaceae bacterium]|jgi:hypothetical protein|nr:hypothetical protein [Spirochaetaceae bacterium]
MDITKKNRILQKEYRERMYAKGYKQKRIWVPRESDGKAEHMKREAFLLQLEELTAGWSERRLSALFKKLLEYVEMTEAMKKK